ncbi:MAG: class I SAM-dependent rRNA methyltransferase [Anaerolineae bacterium]|nr:class I SAM-dependent rRNA methyltransferase [Anaerolineae bacterium]
MILKPKRSKSVLRQHPWIFSGAIQKTEGSPSFGSLVSVHDYQSDFLAWGHYSPHSQIRVRLIDWNEQQPCEHDDFWAKKIAGAVTTRKIITNSGTTTACRLINAENDGLPGLILDQYQDVVVVQFLSAGMEARKTILTRLLIDILHPQAIFERSDSDVRQKEGLAPSTGLRYGALPAQPMMFMENGLHFLVDIAEGHKSGFYLDQRTNRQRFSDLTQHLIRIGIHPTLLNVFSYTGAFSVYGLMAGALSAVNVESSQEALAMGGQILDINNIARSRVQDVAVDAFEGLRALNRQNMNFDMIVVDPPKFASSQKDVQRASRGYKDINMQALRLLAPGGYLFTFSCSGAISDDLFQKILFGAALDAHRNIQIVGRMTQSEDHPVAITFPEGSYLKGLICRLSE